MHMRIKIFSAATVAKAEASVNKFLEENDIEVKSINVSVTGNDRIEIYVVTVVYWADVPEEV